MHNSSSSDSDSSDPQDSENEKTSKFDELYEPLLGKKRRDYPSRKETITQGSTQLTISSAENFSSDQSIHKSSSSSLDSSDTEDSENKTLTRHLKMFKSVEVRTTTQYPLMNLEGGIQNRILPI